MKVIRGEFRRGGPGVAIIQFGTTDPIFGIYKRPLKGSCQVQGVSRISEKTF